LASTLTGPRDGGATDAPEPGSPAATLPPPEPAPRTLQSVVTKIALLGVVNALGVYGVLAAAAQSAWGIFWFVLVATLVADVVYGSRRRVPAKYLLPGLLFLIVFQVYVVLYTGYVSFTNYGDGRNLTQEQAVGRILATSERRVPDSPAYPIEVVRSGDDLSFLVTAPSGEAFLGDEDGLHPLEGDAVRFDDTGRAVEADGWETLGFTDLVDRQSEVVGLRVPLSDEPDSGSLRTDTGTTAYLARSTLVHDEAAGTITDTQAQTVYRDNGLGVFAAQDGSTLSPGWRVGVGFDNYLRVVQDRRIRGPFMQVLVWTFAFAGLSVALTFALGLGLALLFNDERMRGRRFYRSLLVLPYAVPSFMSLLVWTGMLNESFGFVNQALLGGASVPWLNHPWLARLSVVVVNLWLGFPYMLLVCTGALQSIPSEVLEAARVDGAGPVATLRRIIVPLLLVSTAPLLIAAFAFNFNNFTVVYFVTRGGPSIPDAAISVGSTDLLISLVYKLSFAATGQQWGFAAAISVLIFVIVATISAVSFRRTRSLEEIN
jgi:arabinogalactan oligomer / maltooligosaccharide transport system permease protein